MRNEIGMRCLFSPEILSKKFICGLKILTKVKKIYWIIIII
jgi:hypothetical protein